MWKYPKGHKSGNNGYRNNKKKDIKSKANK